MKLLVIGASGKTGHEVVRQALAAGHEVTAFVRDPTRLAVRDARLSITTGDARNTDDLRRALQGQDAVIATLGGRPRQVLVDRLRGRPDHIMERSTTALVAAASEAGVRRVVLLSTFMLAENFRAGILTPIIAFYRPMNDDKRAGEQALRRSQLDWTIVYATRLTDGQRSGRERLVPATETVTARNAVSRADVAAFLLAQINKETSIGECVVLTAT